MPRNHLPRGFINTRTHVPARDSHLSSLLSFLLLFSSSHGQFSKVQRALIIEEAGANNPASIPVYAGGRKEGREEWWKTTTIVVAWIHKRWPSTRRTETGPEFSSCWNVKRKKERGKKSHKVSLLLATTTIHWRSGSSFSPAPSRLILICLSGPRFNSFDVPCALVLGRVARGEGNWKLSQGDRVFARIQCVGNWYRLYNVRPMDFYIT